MSTRNLPDLGESQTPDCFCIGPFPEAACPTHGVATFLRTLLVDEGPAVTVTPSSDDGISVEVGHRPASTALTAEEWRALEAERRKQPKRDPHLDPPIPAWALEGSQS